LDLNHKNLTPGTKNTNSAKMETSNQPLLQPLSLKSDGTQQQPSLLPTNSLLTQMPVITFFIIDGVLLMALYNDSGLVAPRLS